MLTPMARSRLIVLVLGAAIGAAVAALIAPQLRGFFAVPTGGVGATTVSHYPKGWDYAVIALLTSFSFLGALAATRVPSPREAGRGWREAPGEGRSVLLVSTIVFLLMLFAHDHPYSFMDMYHEGEHLAPASVYLDGGRPYKDVFVLHGLATDGGLDALVLGSSPSPLKTRRLETVLDAVALALLVPIAAEVATTTFGFLGAALVGLCAVGAGLVPVFPYYRWIPLLIAVLAVLRRQWWVACLASTLGLLWSVEIGLYSIAATAAMLLLIRPKTWAPLVAVVAPFVVLLAVKADIHHFLVDSFVAIPRAADAIAALPARPLTSFEWETARYYLPPVFYGLALVLALQAWRRGDKERALQIAALTLFSIPAFRTAAGRCSWSHTRFGIPLLGIGVVAFVVEPAVLETIRTRRAWRIALLALVAIPFALYFEIWFNITSTAKFIAGWRARQTHAGLVPYPLPRGRGIYTYPENAADLAALDALVQRAVPRSEPMLDLSGERALYYLLDRRPAVRCADVGMLSPPAMTAEALQQLNAHPPPLVVLHGQKGMDELDGIANRDRAPAIFAWVDAHYPRRVQAGRYTVALPLSRP
jgi:hypothetical protein